MAHTPYVADWVFELVDLQSPQRWAMTHWTQVRLKFAENKAPTLTVDTIGGTGVDEMFIDRGMDIRALANGDPYFFGRVMKVTDKLNEELHTVQVNAAGYRELLDHRYIEPRDLTTKVDLPHNERTNGWEATTSYKQGDKVLIGDVMYEANKDTISIVSNINAGQRVTVSPREWSQTSSWSRGSAVAEPAVVHYQGRVYRCIADTPGISAWTRRTGGSTYKPVDNTAVPPKPADVVFFKGGIYECLSETLALPTNTAAWRRIGTSRWTPDTSAGRWQDITPTAPAGSTDWNVVNKDSYQALVFNQVEQESIAFWLIGLTQGKPGGDMGITRGPNSNGGRSRDRTFTSLRNSIAEMIDDVGKSTDGFQWWIDADNVWQSERPVRWRDRSFDLAFVYGTTVSEIDRSTPNVYYTAAVLEGDREETTPQLVEVTPDHRGRWEYRDSYSDVVKDSTLRERADDFLNHAGQDLPYYKLTLAPGVLLTGDVQIGDVIPLQINAGPRLDILDLVRVIEIDITITSDGDEKVVVGVDTVGPGVDKDGQIVDMTHRLPIHPDGIPRTDGIDMLGDMLARIRKRTN